MNRRPADYESAMRNAKTLEQLFLAAMVKALHSQAKKLMRESQTQVPVVTETLKNSGYVTKPRWTSPSIATVEAGYNDAKAVQIHENPRSGKTGGVSPSGVAYPPRSWATTGKWKYLEDPYQQRKPKMKPEMKVEIMEDVATAYLSKRVR